MDVIKTILMCVLLLIDVVIIVAVLLQQSKSDGLSGLVSGGSSDTFFGKNKGNDRDAKLSKIVKISGLVFVLISLGLCIIINHDWKSAEDTAAAVMQLF